MITYPLLPLILLISNYIFITNLITSFHCLIIMMWQTRPHHHRKTKFYFTVNYPSYHQMIISNNVSPFCFKTLLLKVHSKGFNLTCKLSIFLTIPLSYLSISLPNLTTWASSPHTEAATSSGNHHIQCNTHPHSQCVHSTHQKTLIMYNVLVLLILHIIPYLYNISKCCCGHKSTA